MRNQSPFPSTGFLSYPRGVKKTALLLVLVVTTGCISKSEYKALVESQRLYHEATKVDLRGLYETLPEPSRSTRLGTVEQQESTLRAAEERAGIAAPGSASPTKEGR